MGPISANGKPPLSHLKSSNASATLSMLMRPIRICTTCVSVDSVARQPKRSVLNWSVWIAGFNNPRVTHLEMKNENQRSIKKLKKNIDPITVTKRNQKSPNNNKTKEEIGRKDLIRR